jgi:hypothetical protein
MFNYSVSEYSYISPPAEAYDFERIAKSWNGSGPKTRKVLEKLRLTWIKAHPVQFATPFYQRLS